MPKQVEDIGKKVLDMNLEICFFNKKLKKHLATFNAVDMQMLGQLEETMKTITVLLGDPKLVDEPTLDVNACVNSFDVHRQLYCEICNVGIKADVPRMREHLDSRKHIKLENDRNHLNHNHNKLINTQVYENSQKSTAWLLPDTNVANAATSIISTTKPMSRGAKDQEPSTSKHNETVELEVNFKKLSKKSREFLRDCRLEHLAEKLFEEGQRIKSSDCHLRICEEIIDAVRIEFPKVEVYPFGSRVSGLGTESSDLDLYVDLNENYYKKPLSLLPKAFTFIEEQLRSTRNWSEFCPILNARTPILRAYNGKAKIDCDLSFGNGLSHCNTRLISLLIETQPLFGKVAAVVKHYAHVADFKMNSYIITLLVVYYFQINILLPPVHEMQSKIKPNMIGPWQGNFEQIEWKKNDAFAKHLIGFFDFFGTKFNFKTQVVCPFLGIPLNKHAFRYGHEQLPKPMKLYLDYMKHIDFKKADPLIDLFAYEKEMVVQDPIELCHNVAKGVRHSALDRFVVYCRMTAENLRQKKKL